MSKLQCRGQHRKQLTIMPNNRVKFARFACPIHNGGAPLLAAYARR